jgi:hypothetical protein
LRLPADPNENLNSYKGRNVKLCRMYRSGTVQWEMEERIRGEGMERRTQSIASV